MKFEKELRSQMVPEWQGAYMNYTSLKSILEEFKLFKLNNPHLHSHRQHHHSGGIAGVYKAFSGLLVSSTTSSSKVATSTSNLFGGNEPAILVLRQNIYDHDLEHGGSHEDVNCEIYETKLLKPEGGGEYELAFFKRLDEEFNEVNNFYKGKVDKVMNEAAVLTKQMDALVAFRVKVEHPDQGTFEQLSKEIAKSASKFSFLSPAPSITQTEMAHMDAIEELNERSNRGNRSEESKLSDTVVDFEDDDRSNKHEIGVNEEDAAAISKILNSVTINDKLGTLRSTIEGLILNKNRNNEGLVFSRQNLKKVEEQLKSAFVNFHQKLQLLKSYSYLNLLAFSKIMKKYDNITSQQASKIYLNMVDNSYIGSSDDITKLMDRVESSFIKYFSKSNRGKGMHILRSKKKKESHRTTFSSEGFIRYMETMFPLWSLFGFLVLHMLLYSANIYFWKRYRVNYPFIFGFKQGTELGYREVFLLSTILATVSLAGVLANLDLEIDITTRKYKAHKELLPPALLLVVLLTTICPFDIVFRSSRIFLLRTLVHCISAPFYKVSLSDFMLADQLSSQGQSLRNVAFYICYYASGDYKKRETSCRTNNNIYNAFYIMLGAFPFWLRALQCFRRFFEEKDQTQGYNGFKYLSIVLAILMTTAYSKHNSTGLLVMAWICSTGATIVAIYWDLVLDWGLLRRNSKNPWLRDKLLVSHKSVYFAAMVTNVFLRFAWLQTVLNIQLPFLDREGMVTVVACLEIIRRGVWNFFRIENEHVNNVGKFRAFTKVPLPFNYDEDQEDKDE
ncbi:phosphate transporter PHO1 homolog 5-like [Papaver somniferum]|uniref:phosphate transporter PHO1 homolog 5-like n=1 Tax=Papaver somniferum TaxID=3469 RepID=UPI000E6FA218|nr:phosphate transporter PHO1 homolog 5-like [Papaver somniferum]